MVCPGTCGWVNEVRKVIDTITLTRCPFSGFLLSLSPSWHGTDTMLNLVRLQQFVLVHAKVTSTTSMLSTAVLTPPLFFSLALSLSPSCQAEKGWNTIDK